MNSTPVRTAPAHAFNRLADYRAEVDFQRVGDAEQGVDGGHALALFHAHDHCVAEARACGDLIEGKLLAQTLLADQFNDPPHNRIALGRFRHIAFLREMRLDSDMTIGTIPPHAF